MQDDLNGNRVNAKKMGMHLDLHLAIGGGGFACKTHKKATSSHLAAG